jgi:hypothetical protein
MEKVKLNLDNINGNAFQLLGAFAEAARRQGWSEVAIDFVRTRAMEGATGPCFKRWTPMSRLREEARVPNPSSTQSKKERTIYGFTR